MVNYSNSKEKILLLFMLKKFQEACDKYSIPYYASGGTCLGAVRHKGFIPWDDDMDFMICRKYYDLFVKSCGEVFSEPLTIRTRENDKFFCEEYIKICFTNANKEYSDISIDVFFLDETNPKRKIFRMLQNRVITDLYFAKKYKVSRILKNNSYRPSNIFKRVYIFVLSTMPLKTIDKLHKKVMMLEKNKGDYYVNWGSCYSYKKATYSKLNLGTPKKCSFENTKINIADNPNELLENLYGSNYMELPPLEKRTNHKYKEFDCKLNIEEICKEVKGRII